MALPTEPGEAVRFSYGCCRVACEVLVGWGGLSVVGCRTELLMVREIDCEVLCDVSLFVSSFG